MDIYSGEAENQWHRQKKMRQAEEWRLVRLARAGQQNGVQLVIKTALASIKSASSAVTDAATSATRMIKSWYSRPGPENC